MHLKLIEIRKSKSLTIYDIAKKLDISPAYYYMIEKGDKKLYYDMAVKISSVFSMKPDEIFYTTN